MFTEDNLPQHQLAPLEYTKQGRGRVSIGILWDTPEIMPERPDAFTSELDEGTSNYNVDVDISVGFVQETYDLDLVCLIYNQDKELIDAVSPTPEENVDLSGAIYHSGDDTSGVSIGDDEQISVELLMLPDDIHHLVFISIIQSGHKYKDVLNAEFRVADGKTNDDLFKFSMSPGADTAEDDCTACIMLSMHKNGEEWKAKNINTYRIDKQIKDWGEEAAQFL